jgi:hypothetical protein
MIPLPPRYFTDLYISSDTITNVYNAVICGRESPSYFSLKQVQDIDYPHQMTIYQEYVRVLFLLYSQNYKLCAEFQMKLVEIRKFLTKDMREFYDSITELIMGVMK